uniref:ATP synthase subunit a n=1 Tax=Cerion tridentatum costellata TaxID=1108932 RepID=A0A1W6Q5W1_9EUPU|nr:ATP synthase subunit 6 [Cerion tridentatum costellata]
MYADLFSSLDGGFKLTYIIPVMVIPIMLSQSFWPSSGGSMMMVLPSKIWNSSVIKSFWWAQPFLITIFVTLITTNLIGLSPWVYGYSSDMVIVSCMALSLWAMILISGWFNKFTQALAHIVPSGSPLAMIPFLVLVETISILIRPLTLTVRLVANISAGHIVLGLLAIPLSALGTFFTSMALYILMVVYVLFEYFVAVIQSYIFTLLLSLYLAEHP